jgi:hypothetical protein
MKDFYGIIYSTKILDTTLKMALKHPEQQHREKAMRKWAKQNGFRGTLSSWHFQEIQEAVAEIHSHH